MSTKGRRVLMISTQPFFEWRGSPIRVKFNLLALESSGLEAELLTMPFGKEDPDVRARIHRVSRVPGINGLAIGPSLPKVLFDVLLLFKAFALSFRHRYDVIHGTEEGGTIAWLVARLSGARCIYEKHSDPASYDKGGLRRIVMRAYRAVEGFTARHADAVICTGPGLAQQAREYAPGAKVFEISDIPSSLAEPEERDIDNLRDQLRESDSEVIVTYVGSFAVYQGIDILFEAIPVVAVRHPAARFLIVGGSPEEISHYRQKLGTYAERVRFEGHVAPDRLTAYLKASDILLAPRRAGINTPLKVLDYFKAGRAIVATDTQANRLILDERCAKLCPFDGDAFADAIGALVENPAERAALAEEARERYRTKFNFDIFRSKISDVYLGLLRDARGDR